MNKTLKYFIVSIGLFLFIEVQVLVFVCVNSYINNNNNNIDVGHEQFNKDFETKGKNKYNNMPDFDSDISNSENNLNKNSQNKTKY